VVVGLFIETFVCRIRALGPLNRRLKCNLSLCAVAAWRQILKIVRDRCPSCDRSAETYRVSGDESILPVVAFFALLAILTLSLVPGEYRPHTMILAGISTQDG
jgi:hypothetical protein